MKKISYELECSLGTPSSAGPRRAAVARSFSERFLGLMGQASMPADAVLVFGRCKSVHTMHMRFPIDLIWLSPPDRDGCMRVLRTDAAMPPWRFAIGPAGAWGVAEVPAGAGPSEPGALLEMPALTASHAGRSL